LSGSDGAPQTERLLTVKIECLDSVTTLKVVLVDHVEVGFTEKFVSTITARHTADDVLVPGPRQNGSRTNLGGHKQGVSKRSPFKLEKITADLRRAMQTGEIFTRDLERSLPN
jgi:hypothetical protein